MPTAIKINQLQEQIDILVVNEEDFEFKIQGLETLNIEQQIINDKSHENNKKLREEINSLLSQIYKVNPETGIIEKYTIIDSYKTPAYKQWYRENLNDQISAECNGDDSLFDIGYYIKYLENKIPKDGAELVKFSDSSSSSSDSSESEEDEEEETRKKGTFVNILRLDNLKDKFINYVCSGVHNEKLTGIEYKALLKEIIDF